MAEKTIQAGVNVAKAAGGNPKTEIAASSKAFLDALHKRGYGFYTGVPCSLLTGIFSILETDVRFDYISAVREDCAVGLAAGAYLAGRKSVVFMQNSGLGVCYNALASLNDIYAIPALIVVSWRGEGGKDAPEHIRMGKVMTRILDDLEIRHHVADPALLDKQLDDLELAMAEQRRPAALIASKGLFG